MNTWTSVALAWLIIAAGVITWLNRAAKTEPRTVRVTAPIDLRYPETTIEVSHTFTRPPLGSIVLMAPVMVRLCTEYGFNMDAAQSACEALYDLARLDTEAFDAELAVLNA